MCAQRWVAPEGVEVHQNDIRFDTTARIDDAETVLLDQSAMGVTSGGAVTVNGADSTKIDVAAATGWSPRGDLVVLNPGQSAVALASNVLGDVNLVCLIYTEVLSNPQPHESAGTFPFTRANRSSRLRIYTTAGFAALSLTDSNLGNDAQDRALLLARVTATGGALTAGSIVSPTSFATINYASQPSNITGVSITAVSSNSLSGNGTLAFTAIGTLMTWTPPGGAIGAGVNVGASGTYTISGGGANAPSITIEVIAASLPATNQSDTITITALYGQVVPRFSAEDWLHRSLQGTGTPSPGNPHGLRVSDLGGVETIELEAHQDLLHSNGIWRGSSTGALRVTANIVGPPNTLGVTAPAGADTYYVNGKRLTSLLNATISFAGAPANAALYEVLVNDDGAASVSARATWPSPSTINTFGRAVEIIDMSDATLAGARNLVYASVGQTLAWDGGSAVAVGAGGRFKLLSSNERDWIEVFVAPLFLFGAPATDAITIAGLADTDAYMRLAMACWTGSVVGTLGFSVLQIVLDKRLYGNLALEEQRDLEARNYPDVSTSPNPDLTIRPSVEDRRTDELRASGVLIGLDQSEANSLGVSSAGGLNVNVAGGVAYIFGRRIERIEQTAFALPDNATSYVYLNRAGILRSSATLTLRNIVGSPSTNGGSLLNSPGIGVVLAKVATAAGAITEILDYRRNVTRLDNLDVLSASSAVTGAAHRAQFLSLQAAIDYALNVYGRNEIRVTGNITESLLSPISLTVPFRIVCDPDSALILSGSAASVFLLTGVYGAIEILGSGPSMSSSITLIDYSATNGYALLQNVAIALSGVSTNLIQINSQTVNERGLRVQNCRVVSTGSYMVLVSSAFDGPLVFQNCYLTGTAVLVRTNLAAPGGIDKFEVIDCEASFTNGIISENANTSMNSAKCVNSILTSTAQHMFTFTGSTNYLLVTGCQIVSGDNIFYFPQGSHSNVRIAHNTLSTSDRHMQSGGAAVLSHVFFENNRLGPPSDESIRLFPDTASGGAVLDLHICGNILAYGIIRLGDSSLGAPGDIRRVDISDNLFEGSSDIASSANIWLGDNVQEWTIADNTIDGYGGTSVAGVKGIWVESNCYRGTITGNTLRTDREGGGPVGIRVESAHLAISGNSITIQGAGSSIRYGIYAAPTAHSSSISENAIESASEFAGDRLIYNSALNCPIDSNSLIYADLQSEGYCIENGGADCSITGNTCYLSGTTGVGRGIDNTVGGTNCAISGNSVRNASSNVSAHGIANGADECAISDNSVELTSTTAAANCIINGGDNCAITGNKVTVRASTGTPSGIFCVVSDCAITGNAVRIGGVTTGGSGILGGDGCTVTGNQIEYPDSSATGTAVNIGAHTEVVISGNTTRTPNASAVLAFRGSGTLLTIVGNHFAPATGVGSDVEATGTYPLFVGNTVRNSAGPGTYHVPDANRIVANNFGTDVP